MQRRLATRRTRLGLPPTQRTPEAPATSLLLIVGAVITELTRTVAALTRLLLSSLEEDDSLYLLSIPLCRPDDAPLLPDAKCLAYNDKLGR
jgi:hypothetical protein